MMMLYDDAILVLSAGNFLCSMISVTIYIRFTISTYYNHCTFHNCICSYLQCKYGEFGGIVRNRILWKSVKEINFTYSTNMLFHFVVWRF